MLYEGLFAVFVFGLALLWATFRRRPGEAFLKTMLVVSIGRVLVDFTRDRGPGIFVGLMLTQVLALTFALACAVMLISNRAKHRLEGIGLH